MRTIHSSFGRAVNAFSWRRAVSRTLLAASLGLAVSSSGAALIGLNVGDTDAYRLVNPSTGGTTVLSFFDLGADGDFVYTLTADPSSNRAYVVTDNNELLRFNLATGAVLGTTTLSRNIVALEARGDGQLVGIAQTELSRQFCTINPTNGTVTLLGSFVFTDGLMTTFTADPILNRAWLVSGDQKLFTFQLDTGVLLANPTLNVNLVELEVRGGGDLVGLQVVENGGQLQVINPTTAANTPLGLGFDYGPNGRAMTTDLAANRAYVVTGNNDIRALNLQTGAFVSLEQLDTNIRALESTSAVPEPGSAGLFLAGGLGLFGWRRRTRPVAAAPTRGGC